MSSSDWAALISIPIISALIGWFTNYLAVKMIFRPRRPVRVLGMKFHGLIPMRQRELAEKLGQMVEKNLVSHRDVQQALSSENTHRLIARLIEEQIDRFIEERLMKNPVIGMFLSGDAFNPIKKLLIEQLDESVPSLVEKMLEATETELDFQKIVEEKVQSFDLGKLEQIIYDISSSELKAIEYLGGVLGFAIGAIQALIVAVSQGYLP